ncbi:hypothetical protein RND81_11G187900 [Saponaria officinalis]|uniref:Uncharacterized protein n=1 Tax=Saponaria officinalis TaxID=3572 RepID=A0AAW1HNY6_SAPOF
MADVHNPDEPTLPLKRPSVAAAATTTSDLKKPKLLENPNSTTPESPPPQNDPVSHQQQQDEPQVNADDEVNGKDLIDRKGKGILIEEDDDDDDDDDDGGDDSDSDSDSDSGIGDGLSDESDFADDPLAEVDLDNILPCRTRRKTIHPGVYLANDLPPDDDSDDTDDPDA